MKVTVTKLNESVIYNGKIYGHGQSFEVDDMIGKSLMERGYVADSGNMDEAEIQTGSIDAEQLKGMTYPALKRLCADMGLSAIGSKETLIARICAVEVGYEAQSVNEVESEEVQEGIEVEESADELPNTSMPE